MGDRAFRICYQLQKVQRNEVTDPGRFRGRMDRASFSSRHHAGIPLLVHCDGAWASTRAGATTILTSPSGIKLRYATRLQFASETNKCTKNITKYEAILLGLRKLISIGVQTCVLHIDSKVVSGQIEKECIEREPILERYVALVRRMESYFRGFIVEYIECNKNTKADELAKDVARNTQMLVDVFFSSA
jgi:ribonuclease HI